MCSIVKCAVWSVQCVFCSSVPNNPFPRVGTEYTTFPSGAVVSMCTVNSANCTLHTTHCTLHPARCTLHTAHCTLHTAHCTGVYWCCIQVHTEQLLQRYYNEILSVTLLYQLILHVAADVFTRAAVYTCGTTHCTSAKLICLKLSRGE